MGNLNPTALYIYIHGNIFTTEEVAQIFYEAMNFLYNEYILLIPLVLHKFGSIVLYFTTAASFFFVSMYSTIDGAPLQTSAALVLVRQNRIEEKRLRLPTDSGYADSSKWNGKK
jgi:hypothetical protein